jgi:hypothetical protein
MRGSRVFLIGFAVVFCCAQAQAGKKPFNPKKPLGDPQVIIAGGKGSLSVGSVFSFLSPTGTSPLSLLGGSPCVVGELGTILGDCVFQNGTDSKWTSLNFTISPSGQIPPFVCLALAYFSGCFFNKSGTQVTFFGGKGISPGEDFQIAVVLWLPKTLFSITAALASSSTIGPSPYQPALPGSASTMALFLSGHIPADWRRVLMPASLSQSSSHGRRTAELVRKAFPADS